MEQKVSSWLPEEEYQKAVGQLRLQLGGVFQPFMMYGLDVFVHGAISEVVKLAEDFSLRCRGKDQPIDLELIRRQQLGR
jgi:hypothetical protein